MLVKLENVRLAFPDIWQPRRFKDEPGQPLNYGATFLIPKGSGMDKLVNKYIMEAAKASKWGKEADEVLTVIRNNPQRFCYTDGDLKKLDGYKGHMALKAKNEAKPVIADRTIDPVTGKLPTLTREDGKPYSGCYVNARVDIFGYNKAGKGISARLLGIQFVKDGEPFSGAPVSSVDDFDAVGEDDGEDLV